MRIRPSVLPLPLLLLLSVQLAGTAARLDEGVADLPSSQLLTRADSYLASGHGSDALELYDILAERDKSSYVSCACLAVLSSAPEIHVDVAHFSHFRGSESRLY